VRTDRARPAGDAVRGRLRPRPFPPDPDRRRAPRSDELDPDELEPVDDEDDGDDPAATEELDELTCLVVVVLRASAGS
jgi:hypothetical protein